MQPDEAQAGVCRYGCHSLFQKCDVDAEFILGQAGGDVVVRVGVDMGIDSQGHIRSLVLHSRYTGYDLDFLYRLDVETSYIVVDGPGDLLVGLSNARIVYVLCRESGLDGSIDFIAAHAVGTEPMRGDDAQYLGVCVGFYGI